MTFGLFGGIWRARRAAAEHREYKVSVTFNEEIDREAAGKASLNTRIGTGRFLSMSGDTMTMTADAGSSDEKECLADLLTIAGEYLHVRYGIEPEYNGWVHKPDARDNGTKSQIPMNALEHAETSQSVGRRRTCIGISLADAFNEARKRGKTVSGLLSEAIEDAAWRADEGETAIGLDNIGGIVLPKSMVRFVERIEFQTPDPCSCSCVSCGGTIYMSCNTAPGNGCFAHYLVEELAYIGIKADICFHASRLNQNESKTDPDTGVSGVVLRLPWSEGLQIRQRHILQGA